MARMVAHTSRYFQKTMADSRKEAKENRVSKIEPDRAVQESAGYRERVYELVERIPKGRVMTYGQIAEILGEGYTPRTVGFVMHAANEENTPWQRVINSQGACSTGRVILPPDKQQRMLEAEGIIFDARGRCDLKRYRWTPEEVERAEGEDDESQPSLFSN
jgi:methylated-DNA-protein-cysteine methyltransferase related protein